MRELKRPYKKSILVDDEDYSRVSVYNWVANRRKERIVLIANVEYKTTSIGRFVLNYTGPLEVDHADRDPYNNQKSNLRLATRQQQMANSKPQLDRQYKGVSEDHSRYLKNPYRAHIKVNGKIKYLGYHKTPEAAAKAYNEAALKYFGEFACLNKIDK